MLLCLVSSYGNAMPITFDITITDGAHTIFGTITTNGVVGLLTPADITGWTFSYDDQSHTISSDDAGAGFSADDETRAQEREDRYKRQVYSWATIEEDPQPMVVEVMRAVSEGGSVIVKRFAPGEYHVTASFHDPGGGPDFIGAEIVTFQGQIIGVSQWVPLPSTLSLLGLGLVSFGYSRHKRTLHG